MRRLLAVQPGQPAPLDLRQHADAGGRDRPGHLPETAQEISGLRLILVPRQKDRFDEVAALLEKSGLPFVRRSRSQGSVADSSSIVLVDTIGELSAVWGLAEVAFVGGSLDGKRGGQNMIEPAAYGAAVVSGRTSGTSRTSRPADPEDFVQQPPRFVTAGPIRGFPPETLRTMSTRPKRLSSSANARPHALAVARVDGDAFGRLRRPTERHVRCASAVDVCDLGIAAPRAANAAPRRARRHPVPEGSNDATIQLETLTRDLGLA